MARRPALPNWPLETHSQARLGSQSGQGLGIQDRRNAGSVLPPLTLLAAVRQGESRQREKCDQAKFFIAWLEVRYRRLEVGAKLATRRK